MKGTRPTRPHPTGPDSNRPVRTRPDLASPTRGHFSDDVLGTSPIQPHPTGPGSTRISFPSTTSVNSSVNSSINSSVNSSVSGGGDGGCGWCGLRCALAALCGLTLHSRTVGAHSPNPRTTLRPAAQETWLRTNVNSSLRWPTCHLYSYLNGPLPFWTPFPHG